MKETSNNNKFPLSKGNVTESHMDKFAFGWPKIAKIDQQFSRPYCKRIAQIADIFSLFFNKAKIRF